MAMLEVKLEEENWQCHMTQIHGLEREPRGKAIEVGIIYQILDLF